jgi:hypothetical protein
MSMEGLSRVSLVSGLESEAENGYYFAVKRVEQLGDNALGRASEQEGLRLRGERGGGGGGCHLEKRSFWASFMRMMPIQNSAISGSPKLSHM